MFMLCLLMFIFVVIRKVDKLKAFIPVKNL